MLQPSEMKSLSGEDIGKDCLAPLPKVMLLNPATDASSSCLISDACHSEPRRNVNGVYAVGANAEIHFENHARRKKEMKVSPTCDEAPYSVFSEGTKLFIVLSASFAALISPLSASAYLPALPSLARDTRVSLSLMNLTITSYLIFQGLAPSLTGTLSDVYGRRPAYIVCFLIYLGANIGLARQTSYVSLLILRCLQATGSSGTVVLGSASVADISTRAERGKYIGYASMGATLGPALGPIIGGLINQFLGWRWIFWFLFILSAALLAVILFTFPETCRAVVGNGSVPPQRWNRPLLQVLIAVPRSKVETDDSGINHKTSDIGKQRPNPLAAAHIATEKGGGLLLVYGGLLYAGYMVVISTLPAQLEHAFSFNSIQVGLCYLPLGLGSLTSRWTVGYLLDKNFKREARKQSITLIKNRQQNIDGFNVEVARLALTLPLAYSACLCIIAYGWVIESQVSLAGPLVALFFIGHLVTGALSTLNTLIVDTHRQSPGTAVAANNLCRCLMGAGSTAFATPLIDRIGLGWTGTIIAGLWLLFSPVVWMVFYRGYEWRRIAGANNKGQERV